MNSIDMSKLGIDAGDVVKVSTRRGNLEVAVRKDFQLPMGMVFMPFCF